MNAKDYIAVFDSGVGGISVLRELLRLMPGENYLYFGDSANAPYGTKTSQQVKDLALAVAQKLVGRGIKALVVACNTATAAAIEALREAYPELIVVGIEPAITPAAQRYPQGPIGIMATAVTLQEEKLKKLLSHFPQTEFVHIPAPGLVELVEEGKADCPETSALLAPILQPYQGKLQALVLGCTHYPFAANAIQKILPQTPLYDGGCGTARQTKLRLQEAGLLLEGEGSVTIENSLQSQDILCLSWKLLKQEASYG